jgi:hypothetical protein
MQRFGGIQSPTQREVLPENGNQEGSKKGKQEVIDQEGVC